jgi:hypothetical protein
MAIEKKLAEVTVRLPESLKHDLQDEAAHEDRTLSEIVRLMLESSMYGLKARRDNQCSQQHERTTSRGNE